VEPDRQALPGGEFEQSEDRMTMSRKKRNTKPVAAAAELAHELVDSTPPSETKADWIETVLDEQSPHWNAFSPASG
jgi:hypothetical protein